MAKERVEVAAAVCHARDQNVRAFYPVQDDIVLNGEGSPARAQVVTSAAYLRLAGKEFEPLGDSVNLSLCNVYAPAFRGDVIRDTLQVTLGARGNLWAISALRISRRRGDLACRVLLPRPVRAWIPA
jgi:hypothetical protein